MPNLALDNQRLEAFRVANGLTHADLARKIGIQYIAYWRLRKHGHPPSEKVVAGLAALAGEPVPFCILKGSAQQ